MNIYFLGVLASLGIVSVPRPAYTEYRVSQLIPPVKRHTPAWKGSAIRKEIAVAMAKTMWGEARSTGREGMRAVGHVILNRSLAREVRYGEGIKGVVRKRKQFSCWNPGDPNRTKIKAINHLDPDGISYRRWEQALELAYRIIDGVDKDNTVGATFYHTTTIKPYWRKDMKVVGIMYGHIFYKPKRKGATFE